MRAAVLLVIVASATPAAAQWPLTPSTVRETAHHVEVTLRHGLARVEHRIRFRNTTPEVVEACRVLRAPEPYAVDTLTVCRGTHCRRAVVADYDTPAWDRALFAPFRGNRPIARLRAYPSGGLEVCVAPVDSAAETEVRTALVTRTETHGGTTRLALEHAADGVPGRIAPATLGVTAPDHLAVRAPATLATTGATGIEADYAPGTIVRSAFRARCGDDDCVRIHLAAGPAVAPRAPSRVAVVLDLSQSTCEIAARVPRTHSAVAALLASLPPTTRVHGLAFAAETRDLWRGGRPPAAARDALAAAAAEPPAIGISTRFTSVWARIRALASASDEPLDVVFVGDGHFDNDADVDAAIDAASRVHIRISYLSLLRGVSHDVARLARGTGGDSFALAPDSVPRRIWGVDPMPDPTAAIPARIAAVFQPPVLPSADFDGTPVPALRAGEEITVEDVASGARFSVGGQAMPIVAAPAGLEPGIVAVVRAARGSPPPERDLVALRPRDLALAFKAETGSSWRPAEGAGLAAHTNHSFSAPPPPIPPRAPGAPHLVVAAITHPRAATPHETLRRLVRAVTPAVRGCFATERAGRPSWSGRGTLTLVVGTAGLEHLGVAEATSARLQQCLAGVARHVAAPPFPARYVIHYPFTSDPYVAETHSASAADPALREDVARELDAAIRALPPPN